ncbi:DUF2076 domain-containing protein [Azospirillum canadense]|uniref:DUF2076 domain-containing protein n=1 Tax=Azospirillum canadense TaxID=403962 RepID=UPI002226A3B3|nr:DUF2076 domain-containing protein [Azospirillum canadense]MCW2243530.1 hypothetical protein [Azospirillum canadense]
MTPEERNLLTDLFKHLREVENQPRDQEAERFIQQMVQSQPASSYYMAQSVLVQQQALTAAQKRIEELEQQLKDAQSRAQSQTQPAGGSFLSNALGLGRGSPWGSRPEEPRAPDPAYNPAPPSGGRGPWGAPPPQPGYGQSGGYAQPGYPPQPGYAPPAQAFAPRGGGFLSGAAQTAAGVAGGMLAANAISSLLHHSPGPFGSAMAAPMGGVGGPSETIINNYYGDSAGDSAGRDDPQGFLPDNTARDVDYQSDDPGQDDPGFDDGGGDDNWV